MSRICRCISIIYAQKCNMRFWVSLQLIRCFGFYSYGLPFNRAVRVLLGHHEEGIGLAVGRGVGAEVVHVHTVHQLGLGPLVVVVVPDPVGHVLLHRGVLQDDVTAGGVDEEAVAAVAGQVHVAEGYDGVGHCDIDAWNKR